MNPIKRIRDAIRGSRVAKATTIKQELGNHLLINPTCSDYENVFAQVRPYINEMSMVKPYGVGRNGGRLTSDRTPELNLLDSPNDNQGFVDFVSSMFTTWLTEDELDIRCHFGRNGRIIGYTVLPAGTKQSYGDGRYYWQVNTVDGIETIERDEVIQIFYSRSPKNLLKGISPATSIRAWAQTEDVLAQYQRAYIENGAIPASITFIRASSQQKYEETRRELESNLRGARNKNKTIYIWRQYDNDSGTESDQIEVKTIQGNNSTLAIKELSDIINDHLNKAYGVSNFILGDDSSAKYDNAELSRYQFLSNRVYPALTAFWSQFQHELDRVTGGLGYGISFDLELPELTDRKRVKAEIAEKNVLSLTNLIQAGSNPSAAVKALGLGSDWETVARGIYARALVNTMSIENKNSDETICGHDHKLSTKCDHNCTPQSETSKSPASATTDDLPPMTADEIKIYNTLVQMARDIMENSPNLNEQEVIDKVNDVLNGQALKGETAGAKALKLLTDGEIKAEIAKQIKDGLAVSEALKKRINDRTTELVNNYGSETRRIFKEALNANGGKSAAEIKQALREVMPTYQAERIARSETTYAFKSGRLENDKMMADNYNLTVKLVWRTSRDSGVCPVCAAMEGTTTDLGDAFAHIQHTDEGQVSWEPSKWNDHGQVPNAHPNCRCYFDEIVEAK